MSDSMSIIVEQTSEIAALELQEEIDDFAPAGGIEVKKSEEELAPGRAGYPGLVDLLITYGPDTIPPLAAALGAWLVAGRKRRSTRARRLSITRNGVVVATADHEEFEQADSTESATDMLTSLLKSTSGDGSGK
jgi:hypothetical protein